MHSVMTTPSQDRLRTELPAPRRLRTGLEAWLDSWRGRWRRRAAVLQGWAGHARTAAAQMNAWRERSDEELRAELEELRQRFRCGRAVDDPAIARALGVIAEAARRGTGLSAHSVQLMGAVGLWKGALVEMATGEGKTLTLALTAMLRGWQGRPCHVVTANDYLARRDARALRRFYAFGGLSVGWVSAGQSAEERRAAYAADVCYATAKELLADLLRDRLALGPWADARRRAVRQLGCADAGGERTVMRGVHAVLVDEADHVLIDEAVTPLIISQPQPNDDLRAACEEVVTFVRAVTASEYAIDQGAQEVHFGAALRQRVRDAWTPETAVLRNTRWRAELVRQALRAREFFKRDQHYFVRDGRVVIIDEGTGRPQEQRSWRQGLHQMIEAWEGVTVTNPADTLASISFQHFFRRVPVLAGVSGTAGDDAAEFWRVYGLPVITLPLHRPGRRITRRLRLAATGDERWAGVVEDVRSLHAAGRPVLVGTRSVHASEELARRLGAAGVPCAVLNARQLEREAEIVAQAGQAGCVTIATNLAGRGTDIRLGHGVADAGGLVVVATELHGAARIDRQLHGRAARQGDPGEVRPWASLEDDLALRELPRWWRSALSRLLYLHLPGAYFVAVVNLRWAQRRTSLRAARQRRALAERDCRLSSYFGGSG